jgi:hypothetical protein
MRADTIRHQFASDNTAAICPEAWTALEQANARLCSLLRRGRMDRGGVRTHPANIRSRLRCLFCVHRHRGERALVWPSFANPSTE